MHIATTHVNTDFDALASLVAAAYLYPGTVGVLPRQVQPDVKEFLAIHKDLFRITSRNDIDISDITRLIIVDTNRWNRLDLMSELQERADLEIILWDHHMKGGDIEPSWECQQEAGANITLMLREMRRREIAFAPMQATLFLMGLYDDTGNLTYPSSTSEDAHAAGYLLENGADLNVAGAYLSKSLDLGQTTALTLMLEGSKIFRI
ncbi:MAG: DHH family phosphoesterase, partial [Desulforhabdus sp.]|nr:DHH family phosphoesterase [Desulforhabdus sp.]